MFANIPDGHDARHERDSVFSVHRNEIADARHHAMMLALGLHQPQAEPPLRQRPHRGMLPDVDMSRAVPDPNHRSLFGRLFALIGRLAGRSGAGRVAVRPMSGGAR